MLAGDGLNFSEATISAEFDELREGVPIVSKRFLGESTLFQFQEIRLESALETKAHGRGAWAKPCSLG